MGNDADHAVTEVLHAAGKGDADARSRLWDVVHADLRRLAEREWRRGPRGATLQPTLLVNEAYIRLVGSTDGQWRDRKHFFAAAAKAMRHILIDAARRRLAAKRGAGRAPIMFDETAFCPDGQADPAQILILEETLKRLEAENPRGAQIVELRLFGGRSLADIAETLAVSERTILRDLRYLRAWLHKEMSDRPTGEEGDLDVGSDAGNA